MDKNNSSKNETVKIEKPWGYEIVFTPKNLPYVGKIIHISAGKKLSLQYHDQKTETQKLLSGRCKILIETTGAEKISEEMSPEFSYTITPQTKHRLEAIEDCEILEVSTPEIGKTVRIEDDYGRKDEILSC